MKCSIMLPCFNKGYCIERVLNSIFVQKDIGFDYEVIVVDDGPDDGTKDICAKFDVQYIKTGNEKYRNPCFAKNIGYKAAKGEVFILQSADVVHKGEVIKPLMRIEPKTFNVATVYNTQVDETPIEVFTGVDRKRPIFFLGSLLAQNVIDVGGESEDFTEPSWEDVWFSDCLIHGLGLSPVYRTDVIGNHLTHWRPPDLGAIESRMIRVYLNKVRNGVYFNNNVIRL